MNEAKTKAVEKLYERIASGEQLSDKEYDFINQYEFECYLISKPKKPNDLDTIIKYGNKAVAIIDKVFPKE